MLFFTNANANANEEKNAILIQEPHFSIDEVFLHDFRCFDSLIRVSGRFRFEERDRAELTELSLNGDALDVSAINEAFVETSRVVRPSIYCTSKGFGLFVIIRYYEGESAKVMERGLYFEFDKDKPLTRNEVKEELFGGRPKEVKLD
ncbi:hypothetical protein CO614_00720 [Lysobacteraceae bacterium NML120232]|nr:hypothetical protein CO608_09305 [Xanthomonadaceae bacterium NML08-0793]PJK13577.1 hypothetical protein CO614_00720 [Xanthomonadaceae bacterium NML120232]